MFLTNFTGGREALRRPCPAEQNELGKSSVNLSPEVALGGGDSARSLTLIICERNNPSKLLISLSLFCGTFCGI